MGKILSTLMGGFLLLFSTLAQAQSCTESSCNEYLVKFSRQISERQIEDILQTNSMRVLNYFENSHLYHIEDDYYQPPAEVLKKLNADPNISYAEPNYSIQADAIPNDPYFPELWALSNTGQYQGTAGVDLGIETVWDSVLSPAPIVVAVLDSGIDYLHEDLAANMWRNPGEIPGNGIDDDHNAYVDDVYGYNFINRNSNPTDDYFHGTHVSGIIGGVANNGIGITGIDWNVKLMALKFTGTDGRGAIANAIAGIEYAINNGAKIINNSWDFTYPGLNSLPLNPALEPVQSLRDAIAAADRAGIIFVAASGNNANNSDLIPHYPSSYSLGNIISVAATDQNDALTSFSNYGNITVDLGAPGSMIKSTFPTWKETPPYHYLSGTSSAAPYVTGAAALLWAANPGWSHRQVIDRILQGAHPVAGLAGKSVTGGRVDLAGSFGLSAPGINHSPIANAGSVQSSTVGQTVQLQGTATDADGDAPLIFQWNLSSPLGETFSLSGARISFQVDSIGTYTATLIVSDGKSLSLPSNTFIYVAAAPPPSNRPPVANAGPNQLRRVADTVLLQGSGTDMDANPLTYRWTLAVPTGSQATLASSTSATASFVVDMIGTYSATLVVSDAVSSSAPVTAKIYITAPNSTNNPPVANPGPNQLRRVSDTVLLQGKGTDVDGNPLTYRWTLAVPAGSQTTLASSTSATASFVADVIGTYSATLVVNDGISSSAPAIARIYVVAAPSVSSTSLGSESDNFSDISGQTFPTISVLIQAQLEGSMAPLDPEMGGQVQLGKALLLDGSESNISEAGALDYEWYMIEKPEGSVSTLQNTDQAFASLQPDVEGRYTIQLVATAGKYVSQNERSFIVQTQTPSVEEKATPDPASAGGCSLYKGP